MADHVCPVWVGHLLANPLRKLLQNPKKILRPYVQEGMTALDIGCAMGFFSLPLAEMVGSQGKVICIDMQDQMIKSLDRRAVKAGLFERMETRVCRQDSLGIDDIPDSVDFALALAVLHEVPDPPALFRQVLDALKPAGKFLVAEPKGHVSASDFRATVSLAKQTGFTAVDASLSFSGHSVLLQKPELQSKPQDTNKTN
jgi:ubiquinone/menaquinone biosynthesis C-methylase UbiE